MRSVLDEFNISKIKWRNEHILPLWVYGTLRTKERFHYYLDGCSRKVKGKYKMDGVLKQMESGDVFVVKDGSDRKATGELYRVSLAGLWRIFHLENESGSFPKAYDLSASRIFKKTNGNMGVTLWFRRREEEALPVDDFAKHKNLLKCLVKHFKAHKSKKLPKKKIDKFLRRWC